MMEPNVEILQRLHHEHRDPDPAHIAQLPKPTKRDNPKGRCNECGGWHGLPAVHLDYMGHAEVTDVLLETDPTWTWEPYAIDEDGLPRVRQMGNDLVLWIRLTIGGVTRPGVGTAPKGKEGDALKELIGDAIRNAGMRFGIALTLWSKADGVERDVEQQPEPLTERVAYNRLIELLAAKKVPDHVDVARDVWLGAKPQLVDGLISEEEWGRILDFTDKHLTAPKQEALT